MLPSRFSLIFRQISNCKSVASANQRAFALINNEIQQRGAAHAHLTNYEMDKVYLRSTENSEDLHISFHYTNDELKVNRDFNFCRKLNEKVEDTLNRIRSNLQKELQKKAKKKKKSTTEVPVPSKSLPDGEITVEFLNGSQGNQKVQEDVTFAHLLQGAHSDVESKLTQDLRMRIIDRIYEVVVNQPWVVNLVLPTSMMAGFNVYPSKVEMQFAERHHSRGEWFRGKPPPSGDLERGTAWERCGSGFVYTITNEDVGYHLKFVLTPGNSKGDFGPQVENIAKSPVQAGPGPCPFETRHRFTQQRLEGDAFRVVSYNILADLYADSDYSRTYLFPYCPAYALKVDYRKQLYLKEILGYRADIICLQEVDMKIFELDLMPVLSSPEFGFQGVISQKGTCGEGVAMFFNANRFSLQKKYDLNIGESIPHEPCFSALWERIKDNKKLVDRICDRSTTLQVSILKWGSRTLLVANTHLYFHPDADHIRLLQMGFCMLYVEHLMQSVRKTSQDEVAIVFCGDFNSTPDCGIYRLMTQGKVDPSCVDWSSKPEEAVTDVHLAQPFVFDSACGTPDYTNYTSGFAACLDYIYYQVDTLEVQQVVPLPTEAELKAHTAIPSVVFPSDHVSLVADLKFRST